MSTERIVIVGGPRTGKSWLAREMQVRNRGYIVHCGDPISKVKEPLGSTVYLPEGLAMEHESTSWIVDNWFTMPGPWICEGWIMARALRKWLEVTVWDNPEDYATGCPIPPPFVDRVIVFLEQRPELVLKRGQVSMHRAVMTVWREIADYFEPITEYAGHESSFHGSGGVD